MPLNLDLPKKPGFFITATDTEVGKTLISGGIAKVLTKQGVKVGPFKPLASGCRKEQGALINSDAEFLAHCADTDLSLSLINPVSYVTPASTILCERLEYRPVDYDAIADAYKRICDRTDMVIVEGIGGVRVPLSPGIDTLDLAACFHLPIIVVARPNLGTINHTLLTIDAIRARGLNLAGVIISGYNAENADIVVETAPDIIAQEGKTRIISIVPFDDQANPETFSMPDSTIETLSMTDWKALTEFD